MGLACAEMVRLAVVPLVGDVAPPGALLEARVAHSAVSYAKGEGHAALLGGLGPPARVEPALDRGD
eukprot:5019686-Pyramimonas_sp.AAC.1